MPAAEIFSWYGVHQPTIGYFGLAIYHSRSPVLYRVGSGHSRAAGMRGLLNGWLSICCAT